MRRSVFPQWNVGDLMGKAMRALIDLFVDDQSGSDAGRNGHELYIVVIFSSADDGFGQTGEIRVIFQIDRQSGRFAQLLTDRIIPPFFSEIGRRQDIAMQQIKRSRAGDADSLCFFSESLDRLADLLDGHVRILGIGSELLAFLDLIIFIDQSDAGVGSADVDGDGIVHDDPSYRMLIIG